MNETLIAAGAIVLAALITSTTAILLRKIQQVHVLVNSNLTAVTQALARKVMEVQELESANALLRGEPAATGPPASPADPEGTV